MSEHAIVIVDDEKNVLSAFKRALRYEPYHLYTVDSGEEALCLLDAREISLVISDYNMPKMNGLELLKKVQVKYPHILAIMLTGQAEIEIAVKAINEAGVYKFIQKPWDDADLKITIRRALESIDLASERDRLRNKIKSRDAILQDLENKYPGITKVDKDEEGYMMLP